MPHIYFTRSLREKFRGVEVRSKSRTTEHKGKRSSNTLPRTSEEILLPAVTRPEIFPAMGKYKREFQKEWKREEGAPAARSRGGSHEV